jgi:hypothetical protein
MLKARRTAQQWRRHALSGAYQRMGAGSEMAAGM